jgi:hypothetical protein
MFCLWNIYDGMKNMSIGSGLAFLSVAAAVGFTSYFIVAPFSFIAAIVVGLAGFKQVADVIKTIEMRKPY